MNTSNRTTALLCGLSMLAMSGMASAEPGDLDFACHVITESGEPTISFFQVHNRAHAEKAALRNPAQLADGSMSPVTEVVECVNQRTEEFRDYLMRERLKTIPQ